MFVFKNISELKFLRNGSFTWFTIFKTQLLERILKIQRLILVYSNDFFILKTVSSDNLHEIWNHFTCWCTYKFFFPVNSTTILIHGFSVAIFLHQYIEVTKQGKAGVAIVLDFPRQSSSLSSKTIVYLLPHKFHWIYFKLADPSFSRVCYIVYFTVFSQCHLQSLVLLLIF